jgi:Competence protein CoiA-like family
VHFKSNIDYEHNSLLAVGIKNGELTEIDNVTRGLDCGCICPVCKAPLVAKRGPDRQKHFAHYKKDVSHSPETIIHYLAKAIIESEKKVSTPPITISFNSKKEDWILSEFKEYEFDTVVSEQKEKNIVPDLIGFKKGRRLYIEIFVTHAIDQEKASYLKKENRSTIEIDLSNFLLEKFDFSNFKEAVINGTNRKWIFNAYIEDISRNLRQLTFRLPIHQRIDKHYEKIIGHFGDYDSYLHHVGLHPYLKKEFGEPRPPKPFSGCLPTPRLCPMGALYDDNEGQCYNCEYCFDYSSSISCLGFAGISTFEEYKRKKDREYTDSPQSIEAKKILKKYRKYNRLEKTVERLRKKTEKSGINKYLWDTI